LINEAPEIIFTEQGDLFDLFFWLYKNTRLSTTAFFKTKKRQPGEKLVKNLLQRAISLANPGYFMPLKTGALPGSQLE
jgi:hypothetical protein